MSFVKFVLALASGLAFGLAVGACGNDGGGGGGMGLECTGANLDLAGSCLYEDGSCSEFRGQVDPAQAQASCAEDPPGDFQQGACPATSFEAGACTFASGGKAVVVFEPTMTAGQLEAACAEQDGCYDGPGGGGGGGGGGNGNPCPGADDALVGSCLYEDAACAEYRGAIDETMAQDDCAAEPAGAYRQSACSTASATSGSCSMSVAQGATIVFFQPNMSAADLEQACDQSGGCYYR